MFGMKLKDIPIVASTSMPPNCMAIISPPERFIFVREPGEDLVSEYGRYIREYVAACKVAWITNIGA